MNWLNYHHLYYFWVIAQEGGVAAAARKLRLTHSTLSAQLKALEDHFETPLFERRGRNLVLTPFGSEAAAYATDIFRLGNELNDAARGRPGATRNALRVGVVPSMPKTMTHRLLEPVLERPGTVLQVREAEAPVLLEALSAGRLHVVLMNGVPSPPSGVTLHTHMLGETSVVFFASGKLLRGVKKPFPECLTEVPLLLPPHGAPLRRSLDTWFARRGLEVKVRAEIDDAGTLRAFGVGGRGAFPVRAALRMEVEPNEGLRELGAADGVRETYYAVTVDRRVRHPAVVALIEAARSGLDGPKNKPTTRAS